MAVVVEAFALEQLFRRFKVLRNCLVLVIFMLLLRVVVVFVVIVVVFVVIVVVIVVVVVVCIDLFICQSGFHAIGMYFSARIR